MPNSFVDSGMPFFVYAVCTQTHIAHKEISTSHH